MPMILRAKYDQILQCGQNVGRRYSWECAAMVAFWQCKPARATSVNQKDLSWGMCRWQPRAWGSTELQGSSSSKVLGSGDSNILLPQHTLHIGKHGAIACPSHARISKSTVFNRPTLRPLTI